MSKKKIMSFNGSIVSVEMLHKLASDCKIKEINLGDSVPGFCIKGCMDKTRIFDMWELKYIDGRKIEVYV